MKKIKNKIKKYISDTIKNIIGKTLEEQLIKLNIKSDYIDRKDYEYLMVLLGQLHINSIKKLENINSLRDVEFKIFSQFGEDGIIQYLINKVDIPNKMFIEFGVSNYLEANTRFLLMNDNWTGLLIDSSEQNIEFIKNDKIYYRHDLNALCSFVTKDNINDLIISHVKNEDVGLLNIDIDGIDYWIWKAIDVVKPRIVVCEYNALFGDKYCVTIPYNAYFSVIDAHYSCLYYGASLPALCKLANEKGYDFIGCDSEGVDAFFVRRDISKQFKISTIKDGYVRNKFRISRDMNGHLNYLPYEKCIEVISDLELYDIENEVVKSISELYFK